jgi:hypothetical protein
MGRGSREEYKRQNTGDRRQNSGVRIKAEVGIGIGIEKKEKTIPIPTPIL